MILAAAALSNPAGADAPPHLEAVGAGTVPWHGDLAHAKTAALISHRPVLVIFTEPTGQARDNLEKTTFSTPEAAALLTACFEPVCIGVDAEAALARNLGVSRLPAACVIDASDRLLAKFDCPDAPAAFVAAAGRAAQESAAAARTPVAGAAAFTFAQAAPTHRAEAASYKPATESVAATAMAEPTEQTAAHEPALPPFPPSPPVWQAEPSQRPMTGEGASSQASTGDAKAGGGRQLLDPAPGNGRGETGGTAPWLGTNANASAATATQPAKPTKEVAENASKPESNNPLSGFFAAIQKPFNGLTKPGETKPSSGPTAAQTTAATPTAAAADPYGSMPLGLEGYCPVTLVDKATWVEGRAQWGARHRGRTYLFAGADQQKAFLNDPDRYAPALSGDDPVLACDQGRQVAGQRRYGVTFQSRTYLFSSPETRTAFAADPQRYTSRVTLAEQPAGTGTVTR